MKVRYRAFDCINSPRFAILKALKDVELDVNEVARGTDGKYHTTLYHLKVLQGNSLVERKLSDKKKVRSASGDASKLVFRYALTQRGIDALNYFPQSGKAKKIGID